VVGFVWSNDPESEAGCSIATGRVTQAGLVKGDEPDKKGHPSSSRMGVGHGGTTPPLKRICVQETSEIPWIGLTNRQQPGCKDRN